MAPSENQQQSPNPAPPSLSAGGHETRDYYAAQDAPRPTSQTDPYLTPYLGLRARLSQTWINRWTILLLLVLIRTLFAIASVDNNLGVARKQALSACTAVEAAGSAMASMPFYMSQGVNELTAKSIEKTIGGLMDMLILALTGVEEIAVFIINLLTSTYVCLITFAVSGSLHVAISVAEDVGSFLNSTVQTVGKDLSSTAREFETALNSFLSASKLGDLLGTKAPTIDITTEINTLNSLKLPKDYDQDLQTLNSSIPTFSQVQNLTNTAIRFPFEEVKKLLNESLPKYTMNSSMFPVPAKEQLTFCSDNDGVNSFFDGLVNTEHMAKKIFYGVIVTLAVLAMAPMGYRELRRFRTMIERSHIMECNAYDKMDAVYIISRPYSAGLGLWLASKFASSRHRALTRWSVAYATTVPALFVLSLAVAGLLSCLCQYILLRTLEREIPILDNQITGFTDKVIASLNNASEQWALGTNSIINDTNSMINLEIFGWVNTTTNAVNHTLNVFVDEMTNVLNSTFGGTLLYDPVMEVLNCLVFLKIEGIQRGLDWVSDHAHIETPLLPDDIFSLGALQKVGDSSKDILATATDASSTNAISDAVDHVIKALASSIRQEAILSACILLIWVIIAFIGIARALFLLFQGEPSIMPRSSLPSHKRSLSEDDHELNQVPPTYERATAGTPQPGNHSGNLYNGQSYTLTPAPLPIFEVNSATSPIMHTGFSPRQEKMGVVVGQTVDDATRRPTHIRASSHGDYAITSPTSPPQINPFLSTNEIRNPNPNPNPFADPDR